MRVTSGLGRDYALLPPAERSTLLRRAGWRFFPPGHRGAECDSHRCVAVRCPPRGPISTLDQADTVIRADCGPQFPKAFGAAGPCLRLSGPRQNPLIKGRPTHLTTDQVASRVPV